mmetsp:Transcript_2378/g.4003  ORF Transcript_2378/g.4003 Transcript_2378/m.4003 type:complete len:322 (-) Transcript_2378:82-1047(-)
MSTTSGTNDRFGVTAIQISLRTEWTAPVVEPVLPTNQVCSKQVPEDDTFALLTTEPAASSEQLVKVPQPVWLAKPNALVLSHTWGPVVKSEIDGVPGAFALSNVLTAGECAQIVALTEAMGYTIDAPSSMGKQIRSNGTCVWLAEHSLCDAVYRRIAEHLPVDVHGDRPVGLNRRWRLYRYEPGDSFGLHRDGSWPGSGVRLGKHVPDIYSGKRLSRLTVLFYLNAAYEGGETSFFVPLTGPTPECGVQHGRLQSVRIHLGGALCFFHGDHELSPLHEGSVLKCRRTQAPICEIQMLGIMHWMIVLRPCGNRKAKWLLWSP